MDDEEKLETVNVLEPIEEESEHDLEGTLNLNCELDIVVSINILVANIFYQIDAQTDSPEPMKEETEEVEEEAGSFSPELVHGEENEEAIDPEEDRAILVCVYLCSNLLAKCGFKEHFNTFESFGKPTGTQAYGCVRRTTKTDSGSHGIKAGTSIGR